MVDALKESWRVLHQGGVLLDFRPLVGSPPIEIADGGSAHEVGSVDDRAADGDSAAADAAIETVTKSGIFYGVTKRQFQVAHYWDSVEEMSEYLGSRRHRMSILPSEAHVREFFDRTVRIDARIRLRCRWRNQLHAYARL